MAERDQNFSLPGGLWDGALVFSSLQEGVSVMNIFSQSVCSLESCSGEQKSPYKSVCYGNIKEDSFFNFITVDL